MNHTVVRVQRCLTILVTALVARQALALPPPRAMYDAAVAQERAVRTALADDTASENVLTSARTTIQGYEDIVRQYPVSGYGDDALWRAGRLALDAFARFGEPRDRSAGERLLRSLVRRYPTSKLAKRVPELLGTEISDSTALPSRT